MLLSSIIVTHQSPIISERGEPQYFSEVSDRDLFELAKAFIDLIRASKELALSFLKRGACEDGDSIDRALCALEALADSISITLRRYFIAPLTPPAVEQGKEHHTAIPTPQDVFYLWVLGRRVPELSQLFNTIHVDYGVAAKLIDNLREDVEKVFRKLKPPTPKSYQEAIERLKLLLYVPADIRPGCSMSKLVPHLLTVSGLASTMFISRYCSSATGCDKRYRLMLALLRLAALLHDIGKPVVWMYLLRSGKVYSHARVSATLLERVKLIDSDLISKYSLAEAYEALKTIIAYHHAKPKDVIARVGGVEIPVKNLVKILRKADRASSNMDRLGGLFAKLTRDLLEEHAGERGLTVEDMFLKSGRRVYEAWLSLPQSVYRKVVERIVSSIDARRIPEELLEPTDPVPNVKVLALDLAGIQSFIRRESLRGLIAASYVVDLATVYTIPRAVMEVLGVPVDSIVYAGGGFIVALAPSWIGDSEMERIRGSVERILGPGVSLAFTYAAVDARRSWPYTSRELTALLSIHKNIVSRAEHTTLTGYEVLCDWCGRRLAATTVLGDYVCDECVRLFSIGKDMFVRARLEVLKSSGYGVAGKLIDRIDDVYKHLLEWISGVDLDEAHGMMYRVAVVKADGNAAGQYMASAINLSEAMLRSIRIDMGLKVGVVAALDRVLRIGREVGRDVEEEVARLYTGLLYAGGDDMLAVWPSHLSIPTALAIAEMFWIINGGALQLSLAIASAKPKHNIWNVIDAVEVLLGECKSAYRDTIYNRLAQGSKAVAVLSVVRGTQQLFKAEVEQLFREYRRKGFLYQPLFIAIGEPPQDIACRSLSKIVGEVLGIKTEIASLRDLETFVDSMFKLSFSGDAHRISSAIHEVFEAIQIHGPSRAVLSLYLVRASQRASEELVKTLFKGLSKLCIECSPTRQELGIAPFMDLYHIAEVFERV